MPTPYVVAVSVAKPRWHDMYGRKVLSSIVRDPSTEPIWFGLGGPEGNETAVHTEDVFCFFDEHYSFWSNKLGVERSEWKDCYWGENLMLTGMPTEEDIKVGDRLRIGKAVFEVSSPRIPCFKLSWRLGQPESFVAELIASGKMGCYLRILEEGLIKPGDEVFYERRSIGGFSILEISKLLHDPSFVDIDMIRQAMTTPGLGNQAAEMLRKRFNSLTDELLTDLHRWQGWRQFSVVEINDTAKDIKSFCLAPVDGNPIAGYRAGQFLTIKLPECTGGVIRNWSISDYNQNGSFYRITIKKVENGVASTFMHDKLAFGDVLDVLPPSGRFVLDRSSFMRTVMISSGIGITPLIAMLKAHAERGQEAPPLLWVHSVRSYENYAFFEEIENIIMTLRHASHRVFCSSHQKTCYTGNHDHRFGYLNENAIADILSETYKLSPFGREVEVTGDYSDFYLCGSPEFEGMVRDTLISYGVSPNLIHSENFEESRVDNLNELTPRESRVVFLRSGKNLIWRKEEKMTILELAEREGLEIISSCRRGLCGLCEVSLRSGETRYIVDPYIKPRDGNIFACCSQPVTDVVEVDA